MITYTQQKNNSRPHVLWSSEEMEKLRSLVKDRLPVRIIAKQLNRSEKAIRRKCEWLGLSSSTTYRSKNHTVENGGPMEILRVSPQDPQGGKDTKE